jgi:tetratricopeptide (TPR) repeat protein
MMTTQKSALLTSVMLLAIATLPVCTSTKRYRQMRAAQLYEEGDKALREKRYTDAVTAYDACLKLTPDDVFILTNKSVALRHRGAETYNAGIKKTEDEGKAAGIDAGKRDLNEAATVSGEAVRVARSSIPIDLLYRLSVNEIKLAIFLNHAETMRVVATVDGSRSEEAIAAMREYIALETDTGRNVAMQLAVNKLLLTSGKGAEALDGYRELLDEDPDSLEATLGVGLALSQSGDEDQFKQAKPYLQRFVERAPDSHPMKADVIQTLSYMN